VYAEVEMRIGALRSLLLEKLLETPSTLHDQKRYIRSLHACALSVNVTRKQYSHIPAHDSFGLF
jgi:hypothetical protein